MYVWMVRMLFKRARGEQFHSSLFWNYSIKQTLLYT